MLRGLVRLILWYWLVIVRDGDAWRPGGVRVKNHTFGIWSAPSLAKARRNSSELQLAFVTRWHDPIVIVVLFFFVFYSLVGQLAFHGLAKNQATPLECPPKACLAQLNRPPISWLADVDVGTESLSFHRVFSSRCKNSIYLFGKCQCFRPHHSNAWLHKFIPIQSSSASPLWAHTFLPPLGSQPDRGICRTRSGSDHARGGSWSSDTDLRCPGRPHLWAAPCIWRLPQRGNKDWKTRVPGWYPKIVGS